jgi:FkbM family methyltransferase
MNGALKNFLRIFLPRSVCGHLILGGPLRGRRIFTSWHDYPAAILGRTELPLLGWFAKNVNPGETWLDIGAHYGYTAIALSLLVGPEGRVFAFEPMLATAGYLAQTRSANRLAQLSILPLALGTPDSLARIQLPTTRGMVDSTVGVVSGANAWRETFLESRLDWLWPLIAGGAQQIDGVKIDVQGMEVRVLRGMADLLKKYRPRLVVEFHAGVARREVLDLVDRAGYSREAHAIEPIPGETTPAYVDDRSYAFFPR